MPRLLMFTPCERVVINQEDNATSLISILENLNLSMPAGLEVTGPSDQALPLRWYIYGLFRQEDGDSSKQFEQRIQLENAGKTYLEGVLPFQFQPDKPNMRTVMHIGGFPIMPVGEASLKVFLREAIEGSDWKEMAEYTLIIGRQPVSETVDK